KTDLGDYIRGETPWPDIRNLIYCIRTANT
ncbi:MAG: hypothetical protein ACI92C_000673, partial [Neolewinella sp.]